ncbi:MAG: 2-hydroxy-3-keto-5-methylthiopentenyl-phosphate phosphatase, partial [Actinomycetota bacterium]
RAFDELYADGVIGSLECMEKQWACIPARVTEAERHAVAGEVPLDPGFGPLVEGLRRAGAEIAVVSDGFGYYVHDLVAPWGLRVFTNEVDFATNAMRYPNADPACTSCAMCGTCKPKVINEAAARGRATVFIGDGTSDRHAARVAGEVFAKSSLADWCASEGIAFTRFAVLGDVTAELLPRH